MVLVVPDKRRRGIGSTLLNHCIAHAEKRGAVRLDATPEGKKLYDTLGFEDEYKLLRMKCRSVPTVEKEAGPTIKPANPQDLADIVEFDRPIFGAARRFLLTSLMEFAPLYAWLAEENGQLKGYCLGRPGSQCEQIGPLVAESAGVAGQLLTAALRHCEDSDVIVDVLSAQAGFRRQLQDFGFQEQRHFIRMCKGSDGPFGMSERQYAIAGPELG